MCYRNHMRVNSLTMEGRISDKCRQCTHFVREEHVEDMTEAKACWSILTPHIHVAGICTQKTPQWLSSPDHPQLLRDQAVNVMKQNRHACRSLLLDELLNLCTKNHLSRLTCDWIIQLEIDGKLVGERLCLGGHWAHTHGWMDKLKTKCLQSHLQDVRKLKK